MRIHALSDVASSTIGEGTSIWQFAWSLLGLKLVVTVISVPIPSSRMMWS